MLTTSQGFLSITWFLKLHYSINIVDIALRLVYRMLGINSLSHHHRKVSLFILLAKGTIALWISAALLHYKLLSK
jgi:hypothetical protein